jgi:hypothetical protein
VDANELDVHEFALWSILLLVARVVGLGAPLAEVRVAYPDGKWSCGLGAEVKKKEREVEVEADGDLGDGGGGGGGEE